MTKGVKEVAPDGNKADETETRRKAALENIKNGKKPGAEELLKQREEEGKKNFKEKTKPKKKENFPRDDTKDLEVFVDHCVKSLDVQLVMVDVNNKAIPQEWTLEYKGKRVAWICPRASMRFSVYLFLKGHRDIIKVYTKEDMDDVFGKIKVRCAELDKEPEPKPMKSKKAVGRQKSIIERLEAMEKKAKSYKDSNGFGLGNIKVTSEVMGWCEKKGYKLQSRSVKW